MAGWGTFLGAIAAPVVKKVLTSLGIGMITYAGVEAMVSSGISSAQSELGALPGSVIQICAIMGIWKGFSIITGGLMAKVSMMVLGRLGKVA